MKNKTSKIRMIIKYYHVMWKRFDRIYISGKRDIYEESCVSSFPNKNLGCCSHLP